jgi:orotate phosphoribosyltransferase
VIESISSVVPVRRGHFLLESGHHTDLWLTLDGLFTDPRKVAPWIQALAGRLRPYDVSAVCGPLLGGAFLAQALSTALGVSFYYARPRPAGAEAEAGLFAARYELPPELQERVRGERVAVVDDVISAGSSVRATVAALAGEDATVAVVAALLVLGTAAKLHFADRGIPLESLEERDFHLWTPGECPLCLEGPPLEDPR